MVSLAYTHAEANREEIAQIAKANFLPAVEELMGTIERSFADDAWSIDGTVSQQSGHRTNIVLEAGILKQKVLFDDVFDMQFVREFEASYRRNDGSSTVR